MRLRKEMVVTVRWIARRLRRETTLTLPWIADRLHMGTWKSLNAKLHRWRKANEKDNEMSKL